MSFREVVDGARVASCLVKVSFREDVDSAPQASVREVVDSACGKQENISWFRMYEFRTRCHGSSGLADYFLFFFRWLPRQGLPMASRWVPSMSCCLFCSMNGHTDVIAPVLLHVLLRCPSAGSWISPLRHPSARSWKVPVETHEFCTLCSSHSLTIFSFLPVTSTTSLLQQARAEGSS